MVDPLVINCTHDYKSHEKVISMKFQVVVEKDGSGYYVAEVPALPGCVSQGKTLAEAKKNIHEAIVGWITVMNEKARKRHTQTLQIAV